MSNSLMAEEYNYRVGIYDNFWFPMQLMLRPIAPIERVWVVAHYLILSMARVSFWNRCICIVINEKKHKYIISLSVEVSILNRFTILRCLYAIRATVDSDVRSSRRWIKLLASILSLLLASESTAYAPHPKDPRSPVEDASTTRTSTNSHWGA